MSNLLRLYYELVYRRFTTGWENKPPGQELVRLVESGRVQPGRAVDLGCGTGRHAIFLAQHGFETTGVDFSHEAIEKARANAQAAGVKVDLIVDDLTDPRQIMGPFDLLVDYGSMDEMAGRARERYVDTLLKLSTAGSLFLFAFTTWPDRWWVRLNPFSMRPGEVERCFGTYFDLEQISVTTGWTTYLMQRRANS